MKARGNPNWGKGIVPVLPAHPTLFERYVQHLGLNNEIEMMASPRLREWVHRHRNSRYVPEWLLEAYGMRADSPLIIDRSDSEGMAAAI